jgi:hypothetical protein
MVKVLGKTFSIKDRKLRTHGIRFTNIIIFAKHIPCINNLGFGAGGCINDVNKIDNKIDFNTYVEKVIDHKIERQKLNIFRLIRPSSSSIEENRFW